jgi:predicted molibdopterin-dependent oxidoreductase YjgC
MNLEGRVTNVVQKITPRGTSRADWMIAAELADMLGHDLGVTTLADVQKKMAGSVVGFGATTTSVAIKRDGVVVSTSVARQPVAANSVVARSSYDFRLSVGRKLYDNAVGTSTSPSLSNLAPGARVTVHPLDLDRVGAPVGGNVRLSNAHSSIVLPVFASESVPRGSAVVPFNQPGADVRELIRHGESVVDVRIEAVA